MVPDSVETPKATPPSKAAPLAQTGARCLLVVVVVVVVIIVVVVVVFVVVVVVGL